MGLQVAFRSNRRFDLCPSPGRFLSAFYGAKGETMHANTVILDLFEEAFARKTWHGPNLWQSLKGVNAEQAAWRPAANRHNIWEETLHAAYWK